MPLADEIRALRDRILADLNGAYDYYTDTKIAWDIVRQVIAAGHELSIRLSKSGRINRIAEAKASRDVLVHNCGVASKTYESKAGRLARHEEGHRIDIPEHYHRQTWELLRKVVMDISNAAIAKAR